MKLLFIPCLILLPSIVSGCARWSNEPATTSPSLNLPTPKLSPDSVIVETVLARFPITQQAELEEVWRVTDELVLEPKHRELMDQNGIRVGVMMTEIPKVLRDRLDFVGRNQSTDALEHAGLAADADNRMRQLQCRAGRRKELLVRRELADPLTVLTTVDGQRISGETFLRASTLFDLRAFPKGDGSAEIQLTPEIQHGDHRQAYVSTEFGLRPEVKRNQAVWKELAIQVQLQPKQILVVSSVLPPKALGKAFFVTNTADRSEEYVVLLVRLAETQLDELFAPELIEQAKALTERNL